MKVLKSLRTEKKLTQLQMARKLGITQQAYANYEVGKRQPDNDTLITLSNLFHVSIDYLLTGKDCDFKDDGRFAAAAESAVGESSLSDREIEMLKKYNSLSDKGKSDLFSQVCAFSEI